METFKIIYTLLGGLGIFFYGMKQMSDALQAIAGDLIRKIINSLTRNRVLAVIVGVVVTMIVQSSSVTTVMTVGFVNAGLMSLKQAIGVIFGSNIGTTITGWIISIKIGKYGLLFIGLGIFPALFSKNEKFKYWGRVLFGVGMIFMGLETMSAAFKPLRSNQTFLNLVGHFSAQTYGSYLASIGMGCLLTMIIQSSSAMLGITMALATTGVIEFHTATALVMGENIGTTITALLASVGASINAKRAARAHAIFNVLGVSIMFIILPFYVEFIEWLVPGQANFLSQDGQHPNIAGHIAAAHTFFNVTATILFLPFVNNLAQLVTWLTPDKKKKAKDIPRLEVVGDSILPAAAIAQAEQEMVKLLDIVKRMENTLLDYLKKDKDDSTLYNKIREYEQITDNIQKEITVFLCKVMEKNLTTIQSRQTQALIRIADELESIADYFERLAEYRHRFDNENPLEAQAGEEFFKFFGEISLFIDLCADGIGGDFVDHSSEIVRKSEEMRKEADQMRDNHIARVGAGNYTPLTALTYSDMVVSLRKVRAHAQNIAEAYINFKDVD